MQTRWVSARSLNHIMSSVEVIRYLTWIFEASSRYTHSMLGGLATGPYLTPNQLYYFSRKYDNCYKAGCKAQIHRTLFAMLSYPSTRSLWLDHGFRASCRIRYVHGPYVCGLTATPHSKPSCHLSFRTHRLPGVESQSCQFTTCAGVRTSRVD